MGSGFRAVGRKDGVTQALQHGGSADLREALDIDSMDLLNFIIAVHKRLGVDIPEIDYPKLTTLDGGVAYLSAKLQSAAG